MARPTTAALAAAVSALVAATASALCIAALLFTLTPLMAIAKEPASAPVTQSAATHTARPATWATPLTIPGVPNLNRVAPNFYRSAQPEAAGFKALATDPGIKTVVSLRAFNSDKTLIEGTGIKLIRIPIHTWHIETEDVVLALATIRTAQAKGPVLLHCQHGADRTGLITALYRVLYQGWTKDAALDEMQNGNFGYHAVWGNIPRYLRNADIEDLRRMVETAAK
jgi:protein tyrosine/serine phosphatase